MTEHEAYDLGFRRGYDIGLGTDVESIAAVADEAESLERAFQLTCYDAESFDREHSPFEMYAADMNRDESRSEALWEKHDAGVDAGIERAWTERRETLGAAVAAAGIEF